MTSNRWSEREHVEPDALKERKINIFKKIIDTSISFYSRNTNLLPPKHRLKQCIRDFHMKIIE